MDLNICRFYCHLRFINFFLRPLDHARTDGRTDGKLVFKVGYGGQIVIVLYGGQIVNNGAVLPETVVRGRVLCTK